MVFFKQKVENKNPGIDFSAIAHIPLELIERAVERKPTDEPLFEALQRLAVEYAGIDFAALGKHSTEPATQAQSFQTIPEIAIDEATGDVIFT